MTVLVKKRDGRKEEFVPEKIVVSMIKTGAPRAMHVRSRMILKKVPATA